MIYCKKIQISFKSSIGDTFSDAIKKNKHVFFFCKKNLASKKTLKCFLNTHLKEITS